MSWRKPRSEVEVASIAVFNEDGELLFGERRDGAGWVMPGGHLEVGEEPERAAVREMHEECGLWPESLEYLGEGVVRRAGRNIRVHCYKAVAHGEPTGENDPDEECETWKWVPVKNGLPKKVQEQLRDQNNITLRLLQLQEGEVRKSEGMTGEELQKVSLTPESVARRMTPHQAHDSTPYHRVETYDLGNNQYHHVYYEGPTSDRYSPVMHTLSGSANPLQEGYATSASGINPAHLVGEWPDNSFVNNPWKDQVPVVVHGETASRGPKGSGTLLYQRMAMVHGRMASDSGTSAGANGVWEKLAKDPNFKSGLGYGKGERHWLQYDGPRPTPMKVIEGDGRSLKAMVEQPENPYRVELKNFKTSAGTDYVEARAHHKTDGDVGYRGFHLDHAKKRIYTAGPYWSNKGVPGGHYFQFGHQEASGPALHALQQSTGYKYAGDLPSEMAETMVRKSEGSLKKMALKDIPKGVDLEPASSRRSEFDYSHHLDESLRRQGLSMTVRHYKAAPTNGAAHSLELRLHQQGADGKATVGTIKGYMTGNTTGPGLKIDFSELHDEGLRGQGLGRKMYEALMAHAMHHFGAQYVTGGEHSTGADGVHRAIAREHGLDYEAEQQPPSGNKQDRGFDNTYAAYRYTLKSEDWPGTQNPGWEPPGAEDSYSSSSQYAGQVFHHGTEHEFTNFEPRPGWVTSTFSEPSRIQRHGHFFTTNPEFARNFAGPGSRVVDAHLNLGEHFTFSDRDWQNLDPHLERHGLVGYHSPAHRKEKWSLFDGDYGAKFVQALKDGGYHSASFEEEDPTSGHVGKTFVVLHPSQIMPVQPVKKSVLDPNAGYSISHVDDGDGRIRILAHHEGKVVGAVHLDRIIPGAQELSAFQVEVDPKHRRKGVASAMYSHAEKLTGLKMRPSSTQSPDGRMLWEGNPNRQFGKSEPLRKADDEPFDALHLLEHPDPAERCLALKLPGVGPEHLLRAAFDPSRQVHEAVIQHPEFNSQVLDNILERRSYNAPVQFVKTLFHTFRDSIKTPEQLERVWSYGRNHWNDQDLNEMLEHPLADGELATMMFNGAEDDGKYTLIQNPKLPAPVAEKVIRGAYLDPEGVESKATANRALQRDDINPDLVGEVINSPQVAGYAKERILGYAKNLPPTLMTDLLRMPDPQRTYTGVKQAIFTRPDHTAEHVSMALKSSDAQLRRQAMTSPKISDNDLHDCLVKYGDQQSGSYDSSMTNALIHNPNMDADKLFTVIKDTRNPNNIFHAAASRPELLDQRTAAFVADGDNDTAQQGLLDKRPEMFTPEQVGHMLLTAKNGYVRLAAAESGRATPEAQKQAFHNDTSLGVRASIAKLDSEPGLATDEQGNPVKKQHILSSEDIGKFLDAARVMASHGADISGDTVGQAVLDHPNSTDEHINAVLDLAGNDAEHLIRHHPRIGAQHIDHIIRNRQVVIPQVSTYRRQGNVTAAALGHRSATQEHINEVLKQGSGYGPTERLAAINTGRARSEDLQRLADPQTARAEFGNNDNEPWLAVSRAAKEILAREDPDSVFKEKVAVKLGMSKLRQARDLILASGKTSLHPKQLPPGDWSAGRGKDGNIHADLLQAAIDKQEPMVFNVSHSTWEGAQRHSDENSKVFQVNITNDQIKKMKDAGVYDTFRRMQQASSYSSHPVAKHHGVGWVRFTQGSDPVEECEYCKGTGKETYTPEEPDDCSNCEATGKVETKEDCPDCSGGTIEENGETVDCPTCDGRAHLTAEEDCEECNGEGKTWPGEQEVECPECGGKGSSGAPGVRRPKIRNDNRCTQCGVWEGKHPDEPHKYEPDPDTEHHLSDGTVEPGCKSCSSAAKMHHEFVRKPPEQVPDNLFVDEVQSDFGQSFVRQAAAQAKEAGQDPDEAAEEAEKKYPEQHFKIISKILFGGKHPNEILHESFQQHLRDRGHVGSNVAVHSVESKAPISLGEDLGFLCQHCNKPEDHEDHGEPLCGTCDQPHDSHDGAIRDHVFVPDEDSRFCATCDSNETGHIRLKAAGHTYTPRTTAHTYSPGTEVNRLAAPGHFNVTYHDMPKKLGMQPSDYGQSDTENNREMKGQRVWRGKLAKTEPLFKMALIHDGPDHKIIYRVENSRGEGPYTGPTHPGHPDTPDAQVSSRPYPREDFAPDELGTNDRLYGFESPEHAAQWFGAHGLRSLARSGYNLTAVPAKRVWRGKSGSQTLFEPHESYRPGTHPVVEPPAPPPDQDCSKVGHGWNVDYVCRRCGEDGTESDPEGAKSHFARLEEQHLRNERPVRKFEADLQIWLNTYTPLAKMAVKPQDLSAIGKATDPDGPGYVDHGPDVQTQKHPLLEGLYRQKVLKSPKEQRRQSGKGLNGITRKVVYKVQDHDGSEHRFLVKPYFEKISSRLKPWIKHQGVHGGFAELTSQAVFQAANLGHLHQKVFAAEHPMGQWKPTGGPDDERRLETKKNPALVVHIEPGFKTMSEVMNSGANRNLPDSVKHQAKQIGVLDFLLNNLDRHHGNLMYNAEKQQLLAVDHSRSIQFQNVGKMALKNGDADDSLANYLFGSKQTGSWSALASVDDDPGANPTFSKTREQLYQNKQKYQEEFGPVMDWWKGVAPGVKKAFAERLALIKDPKVREHLQQNFDTRAALLDDMARHGVESFGDDFYRQTIPLYRFDRKSGIVKS